MTAAATVIENVIIKKKKLRQSKNRKKAWRKHIDLSDIEISLERKQEDERLNVLGEDTSNLLYLDTGDDATKDEIATVDDASSTAAVPLEYTIDTGTGLKFTGKPKKKPKVLYAHRFLEGLPGVKPVKLRSRFRMEHTLDHKMQKKQEHQGNLKNIAKAQLKAERAKFSLKLSKLQKKTVQKLSFDKDVWFKPEKTYGDGFTDASVDHMTHTMRTKFVTNRVSAKQPKKIPAVIVPHAGLSYNPTLDSHQELLSKAVKKEKSRISDIAKNHAAKNKNFPVGALPVHEADLIRDMNSQSSRTKLHELKVDEPLSDDEADKPDAVITLGRRTHRQRLRQLRHKKQLRDTKIGKLTRKRENQVYQIGQFNRELDTVKEGLHTKTVERQEKVALSKHLPPKFYGESAVEVALGDQLHGTLRKLEPTSNPVTESMQHFYKRGLLGSKPRNRNYNKQPLRIRQKRTKEKGVDPFTEEEVLARE